MNNQQFVDWAFDQPIVPEMKLVLLALAMAAGPDGGGNIRLDVLAKRAGCDSASALGYVHRLESIGLALLRYQPGTSAVSSADDQISFGLCIGDRPKS